MNKGKLESTAMLTDKLTKHIFKVIKLRQEEPLRLINFALISFFWETGKMLNDQLSPNKISESGTILKMISDQLCKFYGPYFDMENLALMQRFALKCPEIIVKKISPYITWKYIPAMLDLNKHDQWIFYTRLIIQKDLMPDSLSNYIAKNLFERTNSSESKVTEFPFHDLTMQGFMLKILPEENFFREPMIESFRAFFEPAQTQSISIDKEMSMAASDLVVQIQENVKKIQKQITPILTSDLTLLCWRLAIK